MCLDCVLLVAWMFSPTSAKVVDCLEASGFFLFWHLLAWVWAICCSSTLSLCQQDTMLKYYFAIKINHGHTFRLKKNEIVLTIFFILDAPVPARFLLCSWNSGKRRSLHWDTPPPLFMCFLHDMIRFIIKPSVVAF